MTDHRRADDANEPANVAETDTVMRFNYSEPTEVDRALRWRAAEMPFVVTGMHFVLHFLLLQYGWQICVAMLTAILESARLHLFHDACFRRSRTDGCGREVDR